MRRLFRHRVRSHATRYHIRKVGIPKKGFDETRLPNMVTGSTRSYSVTKQSPHFDHLGSCEGAGVNGFGVARVARRRLRNGFFTLPYMEKDDSAQSSGSVAFLDTLGVTVTALGIIIRRYSCRRPCKSEFCRGDCECGLDVQFPRGRTRSPRARLHRRQAGCRPMPQT